ncbi:hypothetical protein [Burkholderia sp. B21-005]|uniref:hypothetical protein n=1 Tax=Burkholderia sp. B21-005 TaxID=2890406 RepID=UPI001E47C531|nr:hypothetical protein [Burkholderia sp. B21-005]UEP45632.1 hypothetical protein LMA02_23260 [Burkholderia sp. B21-005]
MKNQGDTAGLPSAEWGKTVEVNANALIAARTYAEGMRNAFERLTPFEKMAGQKWIEAVAALVRAVEAL